MHKLAQKLSGFHKSRSSDNEPAASQTATIDPQNNQSVYRFRKQRGVNLGSWFVLERWIADAPFHRAAEPGQSDLDVARGKDARQVLEAHYDTWITEADWAWIAEHGFNTVRIPFGYYHLCGADPSVIAGTDFAELGEIFAGAWARLIRAVEKAQSYGLGVLLDLHAAPGKQNADSHAGTSNAPAFFGNRRLQKHTVHVLQSLVARLHEHDPPLANVVGIELLNEPHPDSDAELKAWYTSAIQELARLDAGLPIYIGDCWKTEQYAEFVKNLSGPRPALIVLDHHLYRCFTAQDTSTPASAHAQALVDGETPALFGRVSEMLNQAGAGLVVGEWSGALNPGSLAAGSAAKDVPSYIAAQLQLYEAHCSGYFFWTYKKQGAHPDKGWCLRDAVEAGVFPDRVGMFLSSPIGGEEDMQRRNDTRDQLKARALDAHVGYWSQFPGKYQHERFGEGFGLGWDDAYAFFQKSGGVGRPVSELGFVGAWARTRTHDHGSGYWEFQHGFNQGVLAAKEDLRANFCQ